jgi:hypothetical protein
LTVSRATKLETTKIKTTQTRSDVCLVLDLILCFYVF